MNEMQIRQTNVFLSGVYEGLCKGNDRPAMQFQLTQLYGIIRNLMEATFIAKSHEIRVLLAMMESRARQYLSALEIRLAVRN